MRGYLRGLQPPPQQDSPQWYEFRATQQLRPVALHAQIHGRQTLLAGIADRFVDEGGEVLGVLAGALVVQACHAHDQGRAMPVTDRERDDVITTLAHERHRPPCEPARRAPAQVIGCDIDRRRDTVALLDVVQQRGELVGGPGIEGSDVDLGAAPGEGSQVTTDY